MLAVDQEVPQKEESATTLSSVTLTSNSGSEMVVGEINKDKLAESQGRDEEDHVQKVRDDGDTEAHNKRPWFPKLSLWKRKQKERSEHRTANLLGFFTGLNPKKSASIYSTLDEPDKGSSSAQNTLERGPAMKDDDDGMSKPEEGSTSQWRVRLRFDPRRFRRLSQFADFSRRKWRGLRRASSSVGFRIRNTFSKLSLKRSSSATQPGAEAGVSTVSSHVPDFGRSFTLSVNSYEFGDDALDVTDPPTFGVQEISEGEAVFKDLQDPIADRSQSTDPNRTPTPPILATNSHAEDL